ncbi:MAG TPA: hypothetical protein ENN22_13445 [bacterium]|nr:hypothetical protein [bacterium]HDQ00169.1 hypothetical protein [bacterium]
MSKIDIEVIYKYASKLADKDKMSLISKLENDIQKTQMTKKHKLVELEGLGKEIWEKIDTQQYLNDLRSEWDGR